MTTPASYETSWTVSHGSLDSVVTFESFDCPIDTESTCRKPPLLLQPQSSDFEPCEIKLNFTQKHEIRQVYVRSTARVYEIYYAPALQSDNEYLCTVRCSAASVEDDSFPATDVKEAISVNSEGPSDILPKARVVGNNKIGTSEDDWVEVKLPVGPDQTSSNRQNYQDLYEATAEINDSEPCMSLTIRLLSLKTNGCVYVDEVYVFADPIDSNDSENQTVNAETSAGSSLMTMLVPTLLGLAKSRSVPLHDQNSSNSAGKLIKTDLEPTASTNRVNLVHLQDGTLRKPSEPKTELIQSQFSVSTPVKDEDKACDWTKRNELSHSRTEVLLEQLVARVSRIEDICVRFEENMLKPINNMEARLQRVEQQVELLGRRPASPSFSRLEPDPRSISSNGHVHDSQPCDEPKLEKTGSFSSGTHKPSEVTPVASVQESPCDKEVEVNDVLESLKEKPKKQSEDTSVASVQETPYDKEVEVNDVIESPKKEKPKKSVSIDDALAAALAGFSSFTKPNDSITVESHEEECVKRQTSIDTPRRSNTDGEDEGSVSSESLKAPAPEFIEEENDEATTSCDVSIEIPENSSSHGLSSQVENEEAMASTATISSPHETDARQESITTVKVLTFDKTDILKYFPDQPPDATSESRVDFESPILEVKFAASENGSLKSPFEALLTNSDDAARLPTDGMLIEERIETANNLLVDLDGDDVGEEVQQGLPPIQHETSFASLI